MAEEQEAFEILGVSRWSYTTTRVLGASQRPQKDVPQEMSVKCNTCGGTFEATVSNSRRKGTFAHLPMSLQITCGQCELEETVSNSGWLSFT